MDYIDHHGAAVSGTVREKNLKNLFESFGYSLVKTIQECLTEGVQYEGCVRITPNEEYLEDGFKYFLVDGFCPEIQHYIELKGGDKAGTTEEKIFFDLTKIQDGVYAEYPMLYIFEGKKQHDKCTRKFIRDLNKLKIAGNTYAQMVTVVMYDDLTKEFLDQFANRPQTVLESSFV